MTTYFGTPRKLPKPQEIPGRVVVLDIAFASEASGGGHGFQKTTLPFLQGLGPRLVAWVDHHDSIEHERFRDDPRFILHTKAEHGACPELITPELVARFGTYDSIVCHNDFDGMMSAAKWYRKGVEPYPGADADARAIDTCIGKPSPLGERIHRALRARPKDAGLHGLIVRHLTEGLADQTLWIPIQEAARGLQAIEATTREIASHYRRLAPNVAIVNATGFGTFDKTLLLLLGQEREPISIVLDRDTVTLAAAFDSGIDFLKLLGLSGGMPTRVSLDHARLPTIWKALGVDPEEANRVVQH